MVLLMGENKQKAISSSEKLLICLAMEIQKIINDLNQYKSEIIKILTDKKWEHFEKYFIIKGKFINNDLSEQFKSIFCRFYILNSARGLNKQQKNEFFKLLSFKENNLEIILKKMYKIPGYKETHKLFLSFGTKLLHTINDGLPIYDGNISYVLELSPLIYPASLKEKIKNRMYIYETLKNDFDTLLANKQIKNYLKSVRLELQIKAKAEGFNWQDNFMSDTKLLDSSLWALCSILKQNKD